MHPCSEMDHRVHAAQRISPVRLTIDCTDCSHFDIIDRRFCGTQRRADKLRLS